MNFEDLYGEECDDMYLQNTKVHKNWKEKYSREVENSIELYNYINEHAEIKIKKITKEENVKKI